MSLSIDALALSKAASSFVFLRDCGGSFGSNGSSGFISDGRLGILRIPRLRVFMSSFRVS